jgi:dTDP-glucose 4,6-dehydratase
LEFAEAVVELTRSKSEIVHIEPEDDRTTDDPKVRRPDITKAREVLGWEPKVALADGLMETIEYFRGRVL